MKILIALGVMSACCFLRAWSLGQWPFKPRRIVYFVKVDRFIADHVEDGVAVDVCVIEPLIWFTSLPYNEILRHIPPVGHYIGDGIYAGTNEIRPL